MKRQISSCLALILLCTGCGGSDNSDSFRNVSGLWTGALTKISDTCATTNPATINVSHQVSQNEDAVTLIAETGVQFLGNLVGDNGFSVDGSHGTTGNTACQDSTRIEYDNIDHDDDTTADVNIDITRTCGATSCRISYTGTASRVSGSPSTVPTATPTGTIVTARGGCLDMNTHPAAGTYSGDGGCGISDAAISIQGQTVVLDPFGGNGATSFAVSSTNSSSASSTNTDLSIKGVSGYSCSMACSPPGTFTVQCFKEGGTTCVEKF